MIVQLNTDNNIHGTAQLQSQVTEKINASFKHYANHISRVEVHLSDQNSHKGGKDDIQCKIEVRINGVQPVTVMSKSNVKEKALDEAVDKMKAAVGTIIGKIQDK